MTNTTEQPATVTSELVPEDQRQAFIEEAMGIYFPLLFEGFVYRISGKMTQDQYKGGYWDFTRLSNGGWYMAPSGDVYQVTSANGWSGELSANGLGIVASLTGFSHLSFSDDQTFARLCARHFHLLREFMYTHSEVDSILRAVD